MLFSATRRWKKLVQSIQCDSQRRAVHAVKSWEGFLLPGYLLHQPSIRAFKSKKSCNVYIADRAVSRAGCQSKIACENKPGSSAKGTVQVSVLKKLVEIVLKPISKPCKQANQRPRAEPVPLAVQVTYRKPCMRTVPGTVQYHIVKEETANRAMNHRIRIPSKCAVQMIR